MYVIKRTGDIVEYDLRKIKNAIRGANKDSDQELKEEDILDIAEEVDKEIKETKNLTVEEIQDTVEDQLMKAGFYKTAKEYIKYRQVHEIRRNAAQHLMESYNELLFADAKDMDLKRDNANIDGNAPMGIMLKLGTEGAKVFYDNYATPEEFIDADREGIIHIHEKYRGFTA
nr:MAG TPA: anaerobic ribonucleoside triphosphate reductase [Caudoviricetes sp.]